MGSRALAPEAALLRALTTAGRETVCRAAAVPVDGRRFLALAARHQVDALCWWRMRALEREQGRPIAGLPEELRAALMRAFAHHSMRNAHLKESLAALNRHFRAAGVEALVFKGPWLAYEAYPDPGTRPIDDVDLGIREADYVRALQALRAAGYRPLGALPNRGSDALRRAHYHAQLRFAAAGRRRVELHFRMLNLGPPSGDEEWVWSGSRLLGSDGDTWRVPGPEAMLLHLALHANQHGFCCLRLLFDLRFALERTRAELDAARFLERVRALRCEACVYHALCLAQELAGAPVASDQLRALRPGALRRAVYRRAWSLDSVRRMDAIASSQRFEAARVYLLEMGTPREKLRYALGLVSQAGGLLRFVRAAFDARAPPGMSSRRHDEAPVVSSARLDDLDSGP